MSAKHKRPFYVFAAVAAICCLVLVTGVRSSKADGSQPPSFSAAPHQTPGALISRAPDPDGSSVPGSGHGISEGGSTDGSDGSDPGDFDARGSDSGTSGGGRGADSPGSGVFQPPLDLDTLPPVVGDPGDEADPQDEDETSGPKNRGPRGEGKKGKGKDKDKDKGKDGDETEDDGHPTQQLDEAADPEVLDTLDDTADDVPDEVQD